MLQLYLQLIYELIVVKICVNLNNLFYILHYIDLQHFFFPAIYFVHLYIKMLYLIQALFVFSRLENRMQIIYIPGSWSLPLTKIVFHN